MHTDSHQLQIVPEPWRSPVLAELAANELVLACLPLDLDAQKMFCHGILVLTSQRFLAKTDPHSAWSIWLLEASMRLTRRDYAGVGTLDMESAGGVSASASTSHPARRSVSWHYTLTHHASARTLVEQFESVISNNLQEVASDQALCPRCQAILPNNETVCALC